MASARDISESPPEELSIIWACQRFNCLPEQGGYMDQDYRLMTVGAVLDSVYSFERRWRAMESRDFAKLDDHDQRIFYMLKDMGVRF